MTVGTACLLFEEARIGERSAFHFTSVPLSEIYVAEGYNGRLDTTFRYCQQTLSTLMQRFTNLKDIKIDKNINIDDLQIPIIEAVIPNPNGGYRYIAFVENDFYEYPSLRSLL